MSRFQVLSDAQRLLIQGMLPRPRRGPEARPARGAADGGRRQGLSAHRGPKAARTPAAPVFHGARPKTWLRNHTFRNGWFDPAATEVGLPGLTPHELRHTDATLAVSARAEVKAVQRMLGQASAAA